MKTFARIVSAILLLVLTTSAWASGTFFDATYSQAGLGSMNYRVYLPESYTPGTDMPVMLYLHSAAERGTSVEHIFSNNYGGFTWTNDWINPLVNETQTGDHQAILIMPQSGLGNVWNSMTSGDNWGVGDYTNAQQNATPISPRLQLAVNILGSVLTNYSADANRVYVTGPSMGGYGTWDALARFPELFAAGMPLSGGGNINAAATILADKPIWMFHGAVDGLISPNNTDQLYQAMNNAGGSPIYSRIPNLGHGGWDKFYTDGYYTTVTPSANTGLGSSVYDWLFAQSLENQSPANPPALAAAPIVLNFGAGASSNNNSFDYTADGSRMIVYNHMEAGDVHNMKDINGNQTTISVTRTGQIGPGGGTSAVTGPVAASFPTISTSNSLYTYGGLVGQGAVMSFIFSGLDDSKTYTFDIFGSVTTPLNITNVTQYTLIGLTTQSDQIDVINNKDAFVSFFGVHSVNGVLTLVVTGLGGSLGYINGLQITEQVPEPASVLLLLGASLCTFRRRHARRAA